MDLKKQKRNAKSSLTRLLIQLSCTLAESKPNRDEICQLLVRIDEQKEICLTRLDKLALGLQGTKTKLNVKVANDETISFMSSTLEIGLESMDGRVDACITAQSSKKICGVMKPVNWIQMKHNWEHLKNIRFPKLSPGWMVDILLGVDYYELVYSMKKIVGEEGQPSARFCPLGWTAVGKVDGLTEASSYYYVSTVYQPVAV